LLCYPGPQVSAEREPEVARKGKSKTKSGGRLLPVLHADAAGVDIGAEEIFVAVPADRVSESVQSFGTFTRDLHSLADWLQACHVRTVAMESTGVYWIPLYQVLETRGFPVFLVNAQHVKNVPGRKSDVSDCQWIQYLHQGNRI
jgi:transposase